MIGLIVTGVLSVSGYTVLQVIAFIATVAVCILMANNKASESTRRREEEAMARQQLQDRRVAIESEIGEHLCLLNSDRT